VQRHFIKRAGGAREVKRSLILLGRDAARAGAGDERRVASGSRLHAAAAAKSRKEKRATLAFLFRSLGAGWAPAQHVFN
jgi:hypothetical protein